MRSSKKHLPDEYQHDAPIGSEIRFNHTECGDTKARLYVMRTDKGWKHHCHNCSPKMSGFTPDKNPSTSKTLERIKCAKEMVAYEKNKVGDMVYLPLAYTTNIPIEGMLWLYKYGLTDEEIDEYRIGYDPDTDRVILPWFDKDGKLLRYQGRALMPTKCNPKYISVGNTGFAELTNKECPRKVTVVEDLLSAIKVSRFTSTICLFGSHIPMDVYRHLGENYDKVSIWLDHDKMVEAFKYAKRLRDTQSVETKVIVTKLDPKECEDRVIKAQTCYSSKGCAKLMTMANALTVCR